jgi:hypothetical protein
MLYGRIMDGEREHRYFSETYLSKRLHYVILLEHPGKKQRVPLINFSQLGLTLCSVLLVVVNTNYPILACISFKPTSESAIVEQIAS